MALEIFEEARDGVMVVSPKGRIDSNSSSDFEQKLMATIMQGTTRIVINFTAVDYVSSAGLRVLMKTMKELKRKDGQLLLCSVRDYIREVLELSGFTGFLPIHSTLEECLRVLSSSKSDG